MDAVANQDSFPYCRPDDVRAYHLVYGVETFLRRMLRWELFGCFGRQWQNGIPQDIRQQIPVRQEREREMVIVDHFVNSPISFLMTTEVEVIICDGPLWAKAFTKFLPPRGVVAADFQRFVSIRNKVTHFRPITHDDLVTLENVHHNMLRWARRYHAFGRETSYVGGYLDDYETATDPGQEERIHSRLIKKDLEELWRSFTEDLQEYSAKKVSCGLGVVHHHFFLQFRVNGLLPSREILEICDRHSDVLTFVVVGQRADFVRLFIPLCEGGIGTSVAVELSEAIASRISQPLLDANEHILREFGVGLREYVLSDGKPTFAGFIF